MPYLPNTSRRSLFASALLTRIATLLGRPAAATAATPAAMPMRGAGPGIYQRFGVEPFINCTSTYTINGGSRQLPEVIAAVEQAAHYHVNLDELMSKVGPRIAELLGGEAAMVSSGAAGSVTCGAAACVAGGDPEKMQKLPDTSGMKDQCIVPKWSRSYYDHAVRAVGVKMIEVDTLPDLEAALSPRVALAHGQANLLAEGNKFTLRQYTEACHRHGVPVLIDAAADLPLRPNPYLAAGVDLVAYSGGKILRGPQTAGILLGKKNLVKAAWQVASPHITFGRSVKVSKEEIVGIAVAVEALFSTRKREDEDREWIGWFEHVKQRLDPIPGLTTKMLMPKEKSYYPTLQINWDPAVIGLQNWELGERLLKGKPRIMTHAEGEGHGFVLRPAAMYPGEYKIVAERLYEEFSQAPRPKPKQSPAAPVADLSGRWELDITFLAGSTKWKLYLDNNGTGIKGFYSSPVVAEGSLTGRINGQAVELRSHGRHEGMAFNYVFTGSVKGDTMQGTVALGWEDGSVPWIARRAAL
ncbi:MAG: aminotransferase class V-fold PLP-dependent enzyme [Bryobacterales bacterium]|nr:aminotransferase class V-fold PLP-dependent enzyme [Bryobacterales bacterium]